MIKGRLFLASLFISASVPSKNLRLTIMFKKLLIAIIFSASSIAAGVITVKSDPKQTVPAKPSIQPTAVKTVNPFRIYTGYEYIVPKKDEIVPVTTKNQVLQIISSSPVMTRNECLYRCDKIKDCQWAVFFAGGRCKFYYTPLVRMKRYRRRVVGSSTFIRMNK